MPATILVVDDERNILLTLSQALQLEGYKVELASDAQVALDIVAARPVDAVLMDVKLPGMDGLTALSKLQQLKPELPVIMMSGHGTIETAVKATQSGARDFLEKPLGRDRMLLSLKNALEHQRALEELATLRADVGRFDMVGGSAVMQRVYALISRAAPSEGRVLITGENGTGKELIARAIHTHSKRKSGPFVKLNCAAVPHAPAPDAPVASFARFSTQPGGATFANFHGKPGDDADRARCWKSATYARLCALKATYDPKNLLRYGHAIRATSAPREG